MFNDLAANVKDQQPLVVLKKQVQELEKQVKKLQSDNQLLKKRQPSSLWK